MDIRVAVRIADVIGWVLIPFLLAAAAVLAGPLGLFALAWALVLLCAGISRSARLQWWLDRHVLRAPAGD